jgi:hypothetical protein
VPLHASSACDGISLPAISGKTDLAIRLLDLINGTEPDGIAAGMTLNHVASRFRLPTGWTFPWVSPFGGSIEYGDLSFGVAVRSRDVVVTSIGIRLWDIDFSATDGARRIPKPRPGFKRSARVDLEGIRGGMRRNDVRAWLSGRGLGFREFENPYEALEEAWQIVANKNTLFSFCRSDEEPWLMDVVVFGRSHPLWPVKDGVGQVRKA